MTDRRRFIKTLGGLAAGSALINPTEIFASSSDSRKTSVSKGDRFVLEWENFTGELKYTFAISSSARNTTPIVLTRLHWGGLVGYGEASLPPYLGETQASVNEFLKKVQANVLPKFNDPFRIEEILTEIDAIAINNTAAKAAVDIALHDLVGKIMEQPWWKIWGFRPEDTPCTSYTIGWDASDEIVKEKTHEASWSKVLKVKLGRGDYEDRRMIRIIRENNPDTPMYIDANQGWKDKVYALDFIHRLLNHCYSLLF